jgi:hypothetical protein
MPALTRRRCPDAREECWLIYFGDVHVGTITVRSGVPLDKNQWGWPWGFYPVSHRGEDTAGTAATFEQARRDFETAWRALQPKLSEADFQAYRQQRAFVSWKYAMWETSCKLPTQLPGGQSRCFCGAPIDIQGTERRQNTAPASSARSRRAGCGGMSPTPT